MKKEKFSAFDFSYALVQSIVTVTPKKGSSICLKK
jgi:hypothetical protein